MKRSATTDCSQFASHQALEKGNHLPWDLGKSGFSCQGWSWSAILHLDATIQGLLHKATREAGHKHYSHLNRSDFQKPVTDKYLCFQHTFYLTEVPPSINSYTQEHPFSRKPPRTPLKQS